MLFALVSFNEPVSEGFRVCQVAPEPFEVAVDIENTAALTLPPPPLNTVPRKAISALLVV